MHPLPTSCLSFKDIVIFLGGCGVCGSCAFFEGSRSRSCWMDADVPCLKGRGRRVRKRKCHGTEVTRGAVRRGEAVLRVPPASCGASRFVGCGMEGVGGGEGGARPHHGGIVHAWWRAVNSPRHRALLERQLVPCSGLSLSLTPIASGLERCSHPQGSCPECTPRGLGRFARRRGSRRERAI